MGMAGPRPPYGGPHPGMMHSRPIMPSGGYGGGPPGMPMQAPYGGMYGMPAHQFAGQQPHGGVRCGDFLVGGVTLIRTELSRPLPRCGAR